MACERRTTSEASSATARRLSMHCESELRAHGMSDMALQAIYKSVVIANPDTNCYQVTSHLSH